MFETRTPVCLYPLHPTPYIYICIKKKPITAFGLFDSSDDKRVFSFKPVHVDVIWITYVGLQCTGALF